jgi:hypothetical protein
VEKSNDRTNKQKGWERNKGEMREGGKNTKEIKGGKGADCSSHSLTDRTRKM